MDADHKKLKKLVKFMREQGVLTLKMDGIELNLAPQAILPDKPTRDSDTETESPAPQFSEADALFWSSPGFVPTDEVTQ